MFSITIRGTVYTARTLAGISAAYCKARDDSGEGASTFPTPDIQWNEEGVARLSYNGRIWPLVDWVAGLPPLYDPAADPVPALLATAKALLGHVVAMQDDDDFDGSTCNAGGILFGSIMGDDIAALRAAIAKAESALN